MVYGLGDRGHWGCGVWDGEQGRRHWAGGAEVGVGYGLGGPGKGGELW